MKQIALLACVFGFAVMVNAQKKNAPLYFNGVYATDAKIDKDGDTIYRYLRFYPDGRVITVSSTGEAKDLRSWFNMDAKGISKGNYSISGNTIRFSSTWTDVTVDYNGTIISKDQLDLHIKSRKTDYEDQQSFHFIKVKRMK